MSTELKDKIQEDLRKRNITPRSIIQTIKNSVNGIVYYARDGKSIILYVIGLISQIIMGIIFQSLHNGNESMLQFIIKGIKVLF